jgi:hypothetical protein
LVFSLVTVVCLALVVVIGAAMWRAGLAGRLQRRTSARDGNDGTAMLEFAMVLPIALFIVLVMMQSTLLMAGNLCVHYAAYCAARTAIVTIPDGPRQPDGNMPPVPEGPNMLDAYECSAGSGGSEKANRIWRAAVWAVVPVSSSSPDVPEANAASLTSGLRRFFSNYNMTTPWWTESLLARKLQYAEDHTAIEISRPAAGDRYGPGEDVTVRVEHAYYLSVPYAARLFAQFEGGQRLDFGAGEYGLVIRALCTLTNEGVQDYVDQEPFLGT